MSKVRYLDFDLVIEHSDQGYVAWVSNSPAGQATAEFPLPFSELEVENFVLRVGRGRRGTRRVESPEMKAAKVFGGRLFDSIFQGEVRGCFRSSLDEARRQGAGLRCRLHLEATELVDLPWEYLYNPTLNRFLSLSVETPLVRYLDLPERIRPLAVSPPLRVLVMISSPKDYPSLDVEREWARLKEAVGDLEERGLVMMERLPQAETTLAGLQRRLRQGAYHIFHFVGHGAFDERAQDGVLLLEDEEGHSRPVSGQYVGTLLHDERTLRLAILNACEGARTSRVDPFAGTAQSLVQQGIPAVIAMQFEISDEAAIVLAHEFYMALADGYPVDAALAEARKAIFAQGNDVEWGKPVLYLRAPDGRIFDVEPVSDKERQRAEIASLYRKAQTAMAQEDWAAAIKGLEAVLALDPAHAQAATALNQARQEQTLATLYTKGREHYEAGRWSAALDYFRQVRDLQSDYKGVESIIAAINKATVEEHQQEQTAALYRAAQAAMAREDWAVAIEKLQAVLNLAPSHQDASVALSQTRQRQELASLYGRGWKHYEAGRWREALEYFRRVQATGGNYKGVNSLIATIEREMTRKESVPAAVPPAARGRNWVWVGIPVVLGLLLILACGTYLVFQILPFQPTSPSSSVTDTLTPKPGAPVLEEWSVFPTEVTVGQSVTIRWRVRDAESVRLQPFGIVDNTGEREDTPQQTKTYTLIATNQGLTTQESLEVVVVTPLPGAPQVKSFTANPTTVVQGQASTIRLTWDTEEADTVTIEPGLGAVGLAGSRDVTVPLEDTVYTLVAKGVGGEARAQVQVKVEEPLCEVVSKGLNLRRGPGTVYEPRITALTRDTRLEPLAYFPSGYPDGQWLQVKVQGTGQQGWVSAKSQYVSCNLDWTQLPPPSSIPTLPAPGITFFRCNPDTVDLGDCAQLEWGEVTNATQVSINQSIGEVSTPGDTAVCPDETTVYVMTATGPGGTTTESATCTVDEPPFAVTLVTAEVNPPSFSGACPKQFDFSADITVNGPGTVTYRWEQSDGAQAPVKSITFAAAGSQTVSASWTLSAQGTHWEQIHILTPNEMVSNQANFTLACDEPGQVIPMPELVFAGTETYEANGKQWVRYRLSISNWDSFPSEMFEPAPDLPPCGENTNASRTWVDIYDATDNSRIYGNCALYSSQDLTSLSFAREQGTSPPAAVYVELLDRRTGTTYTSDKLILTPELVFVGTETYEASGKQWVRYRLSISNWDSFPSEMFEPAPDLPPCGKNTNASRTWVDIYDATDNSRVYGNCALYSPQGLASLSFAREQGTSPPAAVYVELLDRRTGTTYRSNDISLP